MRTFKQPALSLVLASAAMTRLLLSLSLSLMIGGNNNNYGNRLCDAYRPPLNHRDIAGLWKLTQSHDPVVVPPQRDIYFSGLKPMKEFTVYPKHKERQSQRAAQVEKLISLLRKKGGNDGTNDGGNADKEIYSLVITGEGDKFFSAGADLNLFASGDKAVAGQMSDLFGRAFEALAGFRGVSIAAINGFALGGGLELAMSAHFRVASDNAKMGLP